jgi:hypothetical protein
MYGLMISTREFSSDGPVEDIVTPKLRTIPDRNSSKQKHDENMIYRPRVLRGLYKQKLYIERKSQEETGMETSSRVDSPQGSTSWGGPMPPGGEEPPDSVSCPFWSCDFSYLEKIIKILMEKPFANLF